jgi:hypothetical protein
MHIFTKSSQNGESILEILLAVAIFSIVLPAILYTLGALASSQPERNIFFDALVLTEETKNTIQQLKSTNWSAVSSNGDYALTKVNGVDALVLISTTPTPGANGFIRTIHVGEVKRDNGMIVDQGGVVDNATKKITINIAWVSNQLPVTTDLYITRSDMFGSYSQTNVDDFSQGSILLSGAKIASSDGGEDGEITLDITEPEPAIGLKSWWKMSGEYSSSLAEIDAAPNGTNNLQIFGDPTFTPGRFNKKVILDSNNKYMVASSSASLELSGQMSMTAWVRATTSPDNSTIIHKLTTSGTGYRLGVNNTGYVVAQVGNGSVMLTAQHNNKSILDDLWHNVAMTYDGSRLLVFVDGDQGDLVGNGIDSLATSTEPLFVGKDPAFANRNFTGAIDDIQIYNTSLTADEIQKMLYSTYTSAPKDFSRETLFHSMGATVYQPLNTEVRFQIAIAQPIGGSCDSSYYKFVGDDTTESSFFDTSQIGQAQVTSGIPGSSEDGMFINPGQCLRWRAYLYSAMDQGSDDPNVKDTRFTYSQ